MAISSIHVSNFARRKREVFRYKVMTREYYNILVFDASAELLCGTSLFLGNLVLELHSSVNPIRYILPFVLEKDYLRG